MRDVGARQVGVDSSDFARFKPSQLEYRHPRLNRADDLERVRLRSTLAELLSPAMVSQDARGTVADHDGPVDGGGVQIHAGQEDSISSSVNHQ